MDSVISFVRRIVPPTSTNFFVPSTWVYDGASVDLDFVNNRYWGSPNFGVVTDFLSISRASVGYSPNEAGALTLFGNDTLRITDLGLLIEDTATNVALWNRDLTNVVWTPTNITAVKDQTGPDGVANSASSIVATAGNGTILQSITLASSKRAQSAYVKRITGSGTINMTMDNGATWTAISVTSNWAVATIPDQTLANPTVGFQIVTSGDKIAVDFVQNENGNGSVTAGENSSTSQIEVTTTPAARAAEVITAIGLLNTNISASTGSLLASVRQKFHLFGLSNQALISDAVNSNLILSITGDGSDTNLYSYQNGTNLAFSLGGSFTLRGGAKVAHSRDGSGRSVVGSGGTVASDAQDFGLPSAQLGKTSFYPFWGYFRRLTGYPVRLSNGQMVVLVNQ